VRRSAAFGSRRAIDPSPPALSRFLDQHDSRLPTKAAATARASSAADSRSSSDRARARSTIANSLAGLPRLRAPSNRIRVTATSSMPPMIRLRTHGLLARVRNPSTIQCARTAHLATSQSSTEEVRHGLRRRVRHRRPLVRPSAPPLPEDRSDHAYQTHRRSCSGRRASRVAGCLRTVRSGLERERRSPTATTAGGCPAS
jgi:hypothetical protein